jgi:hypothetical protein
MHASKDASRKNLSPSSAVACCSERFRLYSPRCEWLHRACDKGSNRQNRHRDPHVSRSVVVVIAVFAVPCLDDKAYVCTSGYTVVAAASGRA